MSAIPLALRLLQARELAEAGRPDEAERLLEPDGASSLPDEPLALHTLAVIVTRRGDYPRAHRLWQQLARQEPGHPEAAAMLDALDDWAARPAWMRAAPTLALAAVALLVVSLVVVLVRAPRTATAPATAPVAATAPAPAAAPTPLAPIPAYAATPRPVAAQPLPPPAPAEEDAPPPTVSFSIQPPRKR